MCFWKFPSGNGGHLSDLGQVLLLMHRRDQKDWELKVCIETLHESPSYTLIYSELCFLNQTGFNRSVTDVANQPNAWI